MEDNLKVAKTVYNMLCDTFTENKVKYARHDDELVVSFEFTGEDIPMDFVARVDAQKQLIVFNSWLPFSFGEDKRLQGAIATNQINYALSDGSFDYNYETGEVLFRMTTSFRDSLIAGEAIMYMLVCAVTIVDKYNDKLLMVAKGAVDIDKFIENM